MSELTSGALSVLLQCQFFLIMMTGLVGFLVSTVTLVIFGEIIPQAACSRYGLSTLLAAAVLQNVVADTCAIFRNRLCHTIRSVSVHDHFLRRFFSVEQSA